MYTTIRMTIAAALCSAVCLSAGALDLKKLPNLIPGVPKNQAAPTAETAPASTGDAIALQEGVVQKYRLASAQINTAQKELALAFGLKEEAARLEAQAQALQSGPTWEKDDIKKQASLSADADAAIQKKLDEGAELTEEGRKHYIASLVPFVEGISLTKKLPPELQTFSSAAQAQLSSAGIMEKMQVTSKLSAGMYLVKELPGHTTRSLGSFQKIVTYAQKNKIPVPKNATALLSSTEEE